MKYPKAEIKKLSNDNIILIPEEKLIDVKRLQNFRVGELVSNRSGGNFANVSFWLNGSYDWQIVNDAGGCLVLVPTLKDEG